MKQESVQHVAEVTSTPMTYLASAGTILAGLTLDEWQAIGVAGGLILGTLTFAVNWWYKHKHYKLARASDEA